jgi:hypothetical protein
MNDTLKHASVVIEDNTQKMEKSAEIIAQNTKNMKETGLLIAENTRAIREYTSPMRFIFPVFWASILLFNYYFFRKIIKFFKSPIQ